MTEPVPSRRPIFSLDYTKITAMVVGTFTAISGAITLPNVYQEKGPANLSDATIVAATFVCIFAIAVAYVYFTRSRFDFYSTYVKISKARRSVVIPYSQVTLDWQIDRRGRKWCSISAEQIDASRQNNWRFLNVLVPKAGTTTFLFLKEKTGLASAQELEEAKPEITRQVQRRKRFMRVMVLVSSIGGAFGVAGGILTLNAFELHLSNSIFGLFLAALVLGIMMFLIGISAILRTL